MIYIWWMVGRSLSISISCIAVASLTVTVKSAPITVGKSLVCHAVGDKCVAASLSLDIAFYTV
ncbi:hypothetical protein [Nostoc sp.]|uniref:hypothetical protein n=1 Tax=Nostoc sp. TaxID=1180 RepID=UPI002FF890E7